MGVKLQNSIKEIISLIDLITFYITVIILSYNFRPPFLVFNNDVNGKIRDIQNHRFTLVSMDFKLPKKKKTTYQIKVYFPTLITFVLDSSLRIVLIGIFQGQRDRVRRTRIRPT